jgi:hypothetical protein
MPLHTARPCGWRATALVMLAALLASCAVLLAACGGAASSVQLPPRSPSARPTTVSKPRTLSARQQVLAAYTGYNAALRIADNSRDPAELRRLMRPYLQPGTISNLVRFDRSVWAKDEIFYGHIVYHVLGVRVDGSHAFVHDCDNTTMSGLEDLSTGQQVPGSAGVPEQNIVTQLNLIAGRWLIGLQTIEDVPCKP